jgi:DNA polymerase-3 subunit alpha
VGIFQFEGNYAFDLLCRFKPQKINDMSLVNASLRPSGASYRNNLIARQFNTNPSTIIDDLLKDNDGYLVFQEDTIKFLTNICGFSGSEADNIRRAIGRKQRERLEKALPQILEGYCSKSDKSREIAEEEAKTFLQIIEDSSDYQFGYNHSTMYSMIGYVCAWLRYYYPLEFVTAYLNNSKTDEDRQTGIELIKLKGIKIKPIKFRYSMSGYTADKNSNSIYQGIGSIKHCGKNIAKELYNLKSGKYDNFMWLLEDIKNLTSVNSKVIQILIMLNFFEEFGTNKKLLNAYKWFEKIYGRKTMNKEEAHILGLTDLFEKYATGIGKNGKELKTYKDFYDMNILDEIFATLKDTKLNIQEQIKTECDYLSYPVSIWEDLHPTVCIIISIDTKYTPRLKLYSLSTGKIFEYKVYGKLFYLQESHDNPEKIALLGLYDVIQLGEVKERNKSKLINGKWVKLDPPETEDYLNSWGLIKQYKEIKIK